MHMLSLRSVGFMQRSVFSGEGGMFQTMALVTRGTDGTPGTSGVRQLRFARGHKDTVEPG